MAPTSMQMILFVITSSSTAFFQCRGMPVLHIPAGTPGRSSNADKVFINNLAGTIDGDPAVLGRLKVLFLPDTMFRWQSGSSPERYCSCTCNHFFWQRIFLSQTIILAGTTKLRCNSLLTCFFATDLHGNVDRYDKLLTSIVKEQPKAVFLGGDLLPREAVQLTLGGTDEADFVNDYLVPAFRRTRDALSLAYPRIFLILGNDDPRCEEEPFQTASAEGLWDYAHGQKFSLGNFSVYGYSCVPPTPFRVKDWECYDVSRYVPPGCVSPEEGHRSMPVDDNRIKWGTIQQDLASLAGNDALDHAIFLFHTPPYDTTLDRAALDGQTYEHVALDPHVGSIAVRRFIEQQQPLLTLHGHVHESARLTGEWKVRLGKTVCINGAHDGAELSIVRLDLESPWEATRELI